MRHLAIASLALALMACGRASSTAPVATLAIQTPPDFSAAVVSNTYVHANGPGGPYSQYEMWIAVSPALSANAGLVVSPSTPVFVSTKGILSRATPADVAPAQLIEVWHDNFGGYGSAQAPPGSPAFGAAQIVIVRGL